jgi:ribosome assembly protein 1
MANAELTTLWWMLPTTLMITANIPQAEAFGLAPELFGKTSGEVTAPEMVFSHWERLERDPFG